MINSIESIVMSLGNEPAEVLGFKTEDQIEKALIPLMADVSQDETIPFITNQSRGKRPKC